MSSMSNKDRAATASRATVENLYHATSAEVVLDGSCGEGGTDWSNRRRVPIGKLGDGYSKESE